LILVSFQSVRKRLSLLALASTVPFNCARPESLRHRKGNRDHIVFLELYLLYRSTRGFSFSIYADLCSLFRQKSRQRKSSGFQRIQIPLLPRSPPASQQFSERSCPLSSGSRNRSQVSEAEIEKFSVAR
jgi:hypothetical protein